MSKDKIYICIIRFIYLFILFAPHKAVGEINALLNLTRENLHRWSVLRIQQRTQGVARPTRKWQLDLTIGVPRKLAELHGLITFQINFIVQVFTLFGSTKEQFT